MHTNDTNPAATQSQTAAQGGIKLPLITIAHGCTLCGKYSVHQIQERQDILHLTAFRLYMYKNRYHTGLWKVI